jgi:hypothetical protein
MQINAFCPLFCFGEAAGRVYGNGCVFETLRDGMSENARGRIKNERFEEKGMSSFLNSNDLYFWHSYRTEGDRNR